MGELATGDLLAGRFRLGAVLGTGAMAQVWQAEEISSGGVVALKIPRDAAAAQLLAAGHAVTARLSHPGILRPLEWLSGEPPVQVLPLCAADGIGKLRGAGWRELVTTLLGVAEALDYAHRRGVVHGDLKASNILRSEAGGWQLTDFGAGAGSMPALTPERLAGAPPAPADDRSGVGVLFVDLLGGEPAALPTTDLAGEVLPADLSALLRSLLAPAAAARPPGMGAVRAALEELQASATTTAAGALIRPRARSTPLPASADAPPLAVASRGVPARMVYAAFGLTAVAAIAVVIFLPRLVPAPAPPAATVRAPTPEVAAAPATAATQPELDAALGEFMQRDDQLRPLNPAVWAGATGEELRRRATAADAAIKRRDAAAAIENYRAATVLAQQLLDAAPAARDAALRDGAAALAAGEQAAAIAAYERALAIAPGLTAATTGLARAQQLDRVLDLMADADAADATGQPAEALRLYQQVLALDSAWQPAQTAAARLRAAAATNAFQQQMAAGFAAQSRQDFGAARAAFRAALALRPEDATARAALTQIDSAGSFAAIGDAAGEAARQEAAERWSEAVTLYDRALAGDPNLVELRAARERAQSRAGLDADLVRAIAAADQFNDDSRVGAARVVLTRAKVIAPAGPRLAGQVKELERLIEVGITPVAVRIESDTLTEVTVFKVGRLGAFGARDLELRPGVYTAVGSRIGYRDVRVQFRVRAGELQPVVVRCEEAI